MRTRGFFVGLPIGLAILGVLLALTTTFPTASRSASQTPISPGLDAVMRASDHPVRTAAGRIAVWVYFTERGWTPAQRESALAQAEANLSPKAARRRSKVALSGERLVDVFDLPLARDHLAAAAATGAELRQQSRWLNAASYNVTDAQVRALASLPQVRRVDVVWQTQPIEPVSGKTASQPLPDMTSEPSNQWTLDYGASLASLELINVPPVHELGFTGAGVTLGMLDTGFRMTHEALDHVTVLAQYDFAGADSVVDTEPGDVANTHAHGTQVLSVAVGYAPGNLVGPAYNSSVVLVRADNISFTTPIEEDWWVAGLEWAEAQGVDLISSSLGFWSYYSASDLDGDTAAATVVADMAAARGVLVINAAGNLGGASFDVIVSPADGDSVVAVGMTDVNGVIDIWSSSGPTYDGRTKPDVVAHGSGATIVDANDNFAYTTGGGTSLSAPFVAGVAALILERAPFLGPIQVREALRETAGRHEFPDNSYGWGMVDALAAVYYWGPNFTHAPVSVVEDTAGPYAIETVLNDQFPLVAEPPTLLYRVDGGAWQPVSLSVASGENYSAEIPGQPTGSSVEYYFEASDTRGLTARLPLTAPSEVFSFTVEQDLSPPTVVHSPLAGQSLAAWPPAVATAVTDNFGVAEVAMSFNINGGPLDGPHLLLPGQDGIYARNFPFDAGSLLVGDLVSYTITAMDASLGANQTQSGPHVFEIIGSAGRVLVIDDASGEVGTVAGWLNTAGYTTTVVAASTVVASDFDNREVVVSLSGDNVSPLSHLTMRTLLENWGSGGGRLLIEGGETGFAALVFPGYGSFGATVMHVSSWVGDASGPLNATAGMASHALLTQPLAVSPPVGISYTKESDQDAVVPINDANLILVNALNTGSGGAIVYDDNLIDSAAQSVYFPFALSAVTDQSQAQALVVNAVAHLLSTDLPSGVDDVPETAPAVRLLGISPNPFNAQVIVSIEMAVNGFAQLDIYDVRGSRIRRLVDGNDMLAAGPQGFRWDGRDDDGGAVSSGVYFVRLSAGRTVELGKLVLVR